jgi:hypothetical protein
MSFQFIFADEEGSIYAVANNGDLLYYHDQARNGTSNWAFGGVGQKIGEGWGNFRHAFSGGDGIIYAVSPAGDLLYYRDQARNGTWNWAFDAIGQKIGEGWGNFRHVFSGGDGIIYAVTPAGDLLYYRDQARNGTWNWAFNAIGQRIGNGWNFADVFSGGDGVIYAIASTGDLFYYRDEARNGTFGWAFNGVGQRIGRGWNGFWTVFSGGGGIVYAITTSGDLLYYRDEASDGTFNWSFDGIGQRIGNGWIPALLEGYCWPLAAFPGGTIEFKVSSRVSYRVSYLRLKTQPNGDLGIPVSNTMNLDPGGQSTNPNWVSDGCDWTTSFTLTIPGDWRSGIYAARCRDTAGYEFYIVFIVKPVASRRKNLLAIASTNTWSAYNAWGGYSKYGPATPVTLTFLRPNPATTPVNDGIINHLTRADLWILNWMEDAGYEVDLITDSDLHNGFVGIEHYCATILTSHPEYWSLEMVDHLQGYLGNGGSLLYLGGNGMFERCIFTSDRTALTFFNGGPGKQREPAFLRNLSPPRSERAILGVGFRFDLSWGEPPSWNASPYQIKMADHPLLAGTGLANGDLIGETGRQGNNGGGASGWEMDTSNAGNEPEDGVVVGAVVGDDRGDPPANLQLLARGTNSDFHASDMTYYETGHGGFVFSVGSICFGGSLVQDSNLQIIVKNALNRALAWKLNWRLTQKTFWHQK